MKLCYHLVALFAAVAPISAAVVKRDPFDDLLNAGVAIFQDLQNVQAALNAFGPGSSQGSIDQALAVSNQTTILNNDLQKAASDASAAGQLSESQSTLIASAIAQLQGDIYGTLDLTVYKQPKFQAVSGFLPAGSIVENQLVSLKNSTDAFASALIPNLVPTLAHVAPLLSSDFDFHFIRAIQAFNSTFSL